MSITGIERKEDMKLLAASSSFTKLVLVMALMVAAAVSMAQTTGGGTTYFDPEAAVTKFNSDWTGQLNTLAPLIVIVILTGAGYRMALKWIKRGTKM